MHVFKMTSQVSTLGESLVAEWTLEGSHTSMLSKVVSKITAFFENTSAVRISALEIQLDSLCFRVLNTYSLMPLFWNSFKCFVFGAASVANLF